MWTSMKMNSSCVLERPSHFFGIFLLEPPRFSQERAKKDPFMAPARGGERLTILKYAQSFLHSKDLLCGGEKLHPSLRPLG